jgi:hypothetical protein
MTELIYKRIPGIEEMFLMADIKHIAETGTLPDGDGVNQPTQMWAEEWISRMETIVEEQKPITQEEREASLLQCRNVGKNLKKEESCGEINSVIKYPL